MEGKVVMITGATSGVGLVSAREIAEMGAELVLVARNEEKVKKVIADIIAETGNNKISYLIGDLSLMAEVKKVAKGFQAKYRHLDVLMNNAGLVNGERKLTSEGHEATIAINHYASFLLTNLLIAELKNSIAARVINVASNAHKFGNLDLDDLNFEKSYVTLKVYGATKVAMIACTYEMARRFADTNITFNALHPGVVDTNFGKGVKKPALLVFIDKLFGMSITPEEGAKTQIYLATSADVQDVTGKYFVKSKQAKSSKQTYDESFSKKLWDKTSEIVGLA